MARRTAGALIALSAPRTPGPLAPGRLDGHVAVVTGAGRGIGRAVAQRFAAEGAAVMCVDRDEQHLTATVGSIERQGGVARGYAADVASDRAMVDAAVHTYGRIDILHANAAVQALGRLDVTEPDSWDEMYAVNQRSVGVAIAAAVPHMRRGGGGVILLTSSVLGIIGDPELPMYGATKGALRALCRSVAAAYGPDNIRCNTICPGDVDTEMAQQFFNHQPNPAMARTAIEGKYPLRRIASPLDVANAAVFLASDDASFISGIDLVVDGGLMAQVY